MEEALPDIHGGLNNAYIIFCFILGIYAAWLGANNRPLSGNFWGAMWTNTALAGAVFVVAMLMLVLGIEARRSVYYLYALYFLISLPGLFAILQGSDNRRAAFLFGVVALFNGAAAYRAGEYLTVPWQ
ncbi:MAG: hypothetical protein L0154_08080 [Chloroflexi bacterium]|nr:hypothetical protein [Chloroflexota bacterium]